MPRAEDDARPKLDERRGDLDLPTLEAYLDMLRKVYLGGASDDNQ